MRNVALALCVIGLSSCFAATDEKQGLLGGSPPGGGGGSITDPTDGSACPGIALVNPGPPARPLGSTGCWCTRRQAGAMGCPQGTGQTASATIGPEGGELKLMGQQGTASGVAFTLTFPPNAIAAPTLITVTETSIPPPAGSVDFSPVYRIEPEGLVLAVPAALKLPWGQAQIWGAPTVFWSASSLCTLEVLPSSYYNAGFNNGSVSRLGYAMTGYAAPGTAPACK